MDMLPKRINNVIYGPKMDIDIDKRGLGRVIFEQMKEYSDKVLQINSHTGEEQTYGEINKKLVRIALEMKRRGVKSNEVILNCSGNNMDAILPVYSALYLNAITVTLDPSIPLRTSVHLLKTVSPRMVFVQENAVDLIEKTIDLLEKKPDIVVMGSHKKYATLSEFLKPHPEEEKFVPDDVSDIQNVSNIFFSSGTTGLPKAILHTNYSMLKTCKLIRYTFLGAEIVLLYTSFYLISAFTFTTLLISVGGARIYRDTFTPETFLELIEKRKVTMTILPSTFAVRFNEENTKNAKTESLRTLIVGGSTLSAAHIKNLWKYFPNAELRVAYGQTELGAAVCAYAKETNHFLKEKPNSSGMPFINVVFKIVDLETGKTLGPNQIGEIRAKMDAAFKGYLSLDPTQEDPFDEEGFLKTGDSGYYDEDNCFFFCDRIKEMFKYQSWHIVPASIEIVMYEHPAVLEAVVVGIPHDLDDNHPFGLVVLKESYSVTEEELLNFVNSKVSEREKLRAGLRIVQKFIKTPTGKLARPQIRQIAISGDLSQLFD